MDTQQSEVKFYNFSDNKSIVSLKIPDDVITKWFEGKRRELKLYIILDISGKIFYFSIIFSFHSLFCPIISLS